MALSSSLLVPRQLPDLLTAGPESPPLQEIEAFVPQTLREIVPAALPPPQAGARRPQVLPALCLWAGLVVCVLRGWSSQLALWRLLASGDWGRAAPIGVSDHAVYKRLAQGGTAPLEALFAQISTVLAACLAPSAAPDLAPFAPEVVALDSTTLDPLARLLPALRGLPPGAKELLPGKLSGLFDLRRQQWRRVLFSPEAVQHDKVLAPATVADLPRGSLILAALGYFSCPWFAALTAQGQWWISRLRQKTSYTVCHVFYQQGTPCDALVWLGAHRADRAAYAVRLVQFTVGTTLYRYLTNVRDPHLLPLHEIARLYARRWDFARAVTLVKRHLGLHLLWRAKPLVVQQHIWAVLTIAQILQALRLEIAAHAGVAPFAVSLALLVQTLPQIAARGPDPLTALVTQGPALGILRPAARTRIRAPHPARGSAAAAGRPASCPHPALCTAHLWPSPPLPAPEEGLVGVNATRGAPTPSCVILDCGSPTTALPGILEAPWGQAAPGPRALPRKLNGPAPPLFFVYVR